MEKSLPDRDSTPGPSASRATDLPPDQLRVDSRSAQIEVRW